MRRINRFSFVLMLLSVTACAPVVYDATYRSPTGRVSVQTTYIQPAYQHVTAYRKIHPIEVTLYTDNTYRGVYFTPIRIVIADNQYVEIPSRDRRGRGTRIYAHYHQKNLHFDSDKSCRGIQGASRYSYDQRWDKGHKYTSINAGRDYDLTGLRLQIRNVSDSQKHSQVKKLKPARIVKEKTVVNNKVFVHTNNEKNSKTQHVGNGISRNNVKRAVVREKTHPVNSRTAKVADRYAKNQPRRSVKVSISKERMLDRVNKKAAKAVMRPIIVDKIDQHEQLSVGKKQVRGVAKKRVTSAEQHNNGKSHKVASVEENVNVSQKNNHRVSVKGKKFDNVGQAEEPEKVRGL